MTLNADSVNQSTLHHTKGFPSKNGSRDHDHNDVVKLQEMAVAVRDSYGSPLVDGKKQRNRTQNSLKKVQQREINISSNVVSDRKNSTKNSRRSRHNESYFRQYMDDLEHVFVVPKKKQKRHSQQAYRRKRV